MNKYLPERGKTEREMEGDEKIFFLNWKGQNEEKICWITFIFSFNEGNFIYRKKCIKIINDPWYYIIESLKPKIIQV